MPITLPNFFGGAPASQAAAPSLDGQPTPSSASNAPAPPPAAASNTPLETEEEEEEPVSLPQALLPAPGVLSDPTPLPHPKTKNNQPPPAAEAANAPGKQQEGGAEEIPKDLEPTVPGEVVAGYSPMAEGEYAKLGQTRGEVLRGLTHDGEGFMSKDEIEKIVEEDVKRTVDGQPNIDNFCHCCQDEQWGVKKGNDLDIFKKSKIHRMKRAKETIEAQALSRLRCIVQIEESLQLYTADDPHWSKTAYPRRHFQEWYIRLRDAQNSMVGSVIAVRDRCRLAQFNGPAVHAEFAERAKLDRERQIQRERREEQDQQEFAARMASDHTLTRHQAANPLQHELGNDGAGGNGNGGNGNGGIGNGGNGGEEGGNGNGGSGGAGCGVEGGKLKRKADGIYEYEVDHHLSAAFKTYPGHQLPPPLKASKTALSSHGIKMSPEKMVAIFKMSGVIKQLEDGGPACKHALKILEGRPHPEPDSDYAVFVHYGKNMCTGCTTFHERKDAKTEKHASASPSKKRIKVETASFDRSIVPPSLSAADDDSDNENEIQELIDTMVVAPWVPCVVSQEGARCAECARNNRICSFAKGKTVPVRQAPMQEGMAKVIGCFQDILLQLQEDAPAAQRKKYHEAALFLDWADLEIKGPGHAGKPPVYSKLATLAPAPETPTKKGKSKGKERARDEEPEHAEGSKGKRNLRAKK